MKQRSKTLNLVSSLLLICIVPHCIAQAAVEEEKEDECINSQRYTFSWSFEEGCIDLVPRGGTSKGASLILDTEPHSGWLALQENGLSSYAKDRLAILAMAGPYRTSFEFIEITGYTPGFKPSRPYQSWGTEYIYVVDEREDFISLQHIMVMFVDMGEDGGIIGPIVQKHWRQDWQFEKTELMTFAGNNTWVHEDFTQEQVAGTWAQSVFQVDDSPRYEAFGKWQHKENFSTWISETTLRPLPRRESSVRRDYQLLEGTNRHTIVPNGWVHEELNYKVAINEDNNLTGNTAYLAKEIEVNCYERIIDFDFSAGDEYWSNTGPYWRDVRELWQQVFDATDLIIVNPSYEGTPLFGELFGFAEEFNDSTNYDSEAVKKVVQETLANFLE